MKTFIYTLSNPITNEVKYVGKTINIKRRKYQHTNLKNVKLISNKHLSNWIVSLLDKNILPKFDVIDEIESEDWQWLEIYWIEQFRQWGFNLTNLTFGGEGFLYKHTEETKLKLSLSHKGMKYKVSEEELNRRSMYFKENNPMFNLEIKNKIIEQIRQTRGFTKTKEFSDLKKEQLFFQINNGNHPRQRAILKLDLNDSIVCEYKSMKECAKIEQKSIRQIRYLVENEFVRNINFKLKYKYE